MVKVSDSFMGCFSVEILLLEWILWEEKNTHGNIRLSACLCIGDICTEAEAILEVVESWEMVLWSPACLWGIFWARRNGYLQGLFGTSPWNPLFSMPSLGPLLFKEVSFVVFDDKRLRIRDPKPGGFSKPLLVGLFLNLTSLDSSRITWRSYGVSK